MPYTPEQIASFAPTAREALRTAFEAGFHNRMANSDNSSTKQAIEAAQELLAKELGHEATKLSLTVIEQLSDSTVFYLYIILRPYLSN